MKECHIYLVPGFFGFNTLGSFDYFRGVSATLRRELLRYGLRARIHECATRPTGFVKYRARELARQISNTSPADAELHLIGHSTGGLDVRQLLTPHFSDSDSEPRIDASIAMRTRSAILVSTPHRGTPMANFWLGIEGRKTLRLLASQASTRGRLAIYAGAKLLSIAAKLDDVVAEGTLDLLSRNLLRHIRLDANDKLWVFLREIAADQGSMVLLTSDWMDHFNETVKDNPAVFYGSIVSASPPPLGRGVFKILRRRPLTLSVGYALLYNIVVHTPHQPSQTPLDPELKRQVAHALPFRLDEQTNDGIVPTLSQPYGAVIDTVVADHLDIVGQFNRPEEGKGGSDWLPSGSNFGEQTFNRVWQNVAARIARTSELARERPSGHGS
jgi:triacylglycerol lipase